MPISDEDAIHKSDEAISFRDTDELKRKWLPGFIMVIIVITALILAATH